MKRDVQIIISKNIATFKNKYNQCEVFKTGSYGIICKGINMKTNKMVALKFVDENKYPSTEVEILKQLNHTNIVKFIESTIFNINGEKYLCIIMDYYEKSANDLVISNEFMKNKFYGLEPYVKKDHINLYRPIDFKNNMSYQFYQFNNGKTEEENKWLFKIYFKQILLALEYLHEKNISHGDINPSNILFEGENAFFCDFGNSVDYNKTNRKVYACNDDFVAPEEFGGLQFNIKNDIWSLGMTFLRIVSGININTGTGGYLAHKEILEHFYDNQNYKLKLNYPDITIKSGLKNFLEINSLDPELVEVFSNCFIFNTEKRMTASQLLSLPYFNKL
ncbi:Protein kinase of the Mitotic Exit Network [Conglomerata obtusa]